MLPCSGVSRKPGQVFVIVIVIVISKFLKRYLKAKRTRAPAYIHERCDESKGGFPKGGQAKLRSDFQNTRRVDQAIYEVAFDDMLDSHTSALLERMVQFCKAALGVSHQRDYHKEFLYLRLIFNGAKKKRARVSYRAPGTFHRARWKAKAIYSINCFCSISSSLKLPKRSIVERRW